MAQEKLDLIFKKHLDIKGTLKALKAQLKKIVTVDDYLELCEQIKALNAKKKQFEEQAKAKFNEIGMLEDFEQQAIEQKQLLTEVALTNLAKGENNTVHDDNGNIYDPIFTVKFKRVQE